VDPIAHGQCPESSAYLTILASLKSWNHLEGKTRELNIENTGNGAPNMTMQPSFLLRKMQLSAFSVGS
jgi:hypothetical protein